MPALPSAKLSALLPLIMPFAKGCPEPMALMQARLAAIEFCEKTRCWRHVTSISLTTQHTAIVTPDHSAIFEFEEATWNGKTLTPVQYTDADPDELAEMAEDAEPNWITQISPGEIALYPFRAGTLRLSMILKPRHGNLYGTDAADPLHDAYNVVPQFMLDLHAAALADGALARILVTKGETFYDPNEAGRRQAMFREACSNKSGANIRGQQRAPVRAKARWL